MNVFGKILIGVAATGTAISISAPASAASIMGLYDTGVDNARKVLANGTADSHYKIVGATGITLAGSPAQQAILNALKNSSPSNPLSPVATSFSAWSANDSVGSLTNTQNYVFNSQNHPAGTLLSSAWISNANPVTVFPGNNYNHVITYQLQFNLGTLNPGSAQLAGLIEADNSARVLLNGVDIGGQATPNQGGPYPSNNFRRFTAFGVNSGFINGLNTLTFEVHDFGSVQGLRVANLIGTAVPEPGSWAMMMLGFGAVASQVRRRRHRGLAVSA